MFKLSQLHCKLCISNSRFNTYTVNCRDSKTKLKFRTLTIALQTLKDKALAYMYTHMLIMFILYIAKAKILTTAESCKIVKVYILKATL
jgi:hypothetical protein